MARKPSRARHPQTVYRYRITHSTRDGIEVGSHVIDFTYYGRGHTWTIFNFTSGEEAGSFHGVYVDKGIRTAGGRYESDAV